MSAVIERCCFETKLPREKLLGYLKPALGCSFVVRLPQVEKQRVHSLSGPAGIQRSLSRTKAMPSEKQVPDTIVVTEVSRPPAALE